MECTIGKPRNINTRNTIACADSAIDASANGLAHNYRDVSGEKGEIHIAAVGMHVVYDDFMIPCGADAANRCQEIIHEHLTAKLA